MAERWGALQVASCVDELMMNWELSELHRYIAATRFVHREEAQFPTVRDRLCERHDIAQSPGKDALGEGSG